MRNWRVLCELGTTLRIVGQRQHRARRRRQPGALRAAHQVVRRRRRIAVPQPPMLAHVLPVSTLAMMRIFDMLLGSTAYYVARNPVTALCTALLLRQACPWLVRMRNVNVLPGS